MGWVKAEYVCHTNNGDVRVKYCDVADWILGSSETITVPANSYRTDEQLIDAEAFRDSVAPLRKMFESQIGKLGSPDMKSAAGFVSTDPAADVAHVNATGLDWRNSFGSFELGAWKLPENEVVVGIMHHDKIKAGDTVMVKVKVESIVQHEIYNQGIGFRVTCDDFRIPCVFETHDVVGHIPAPAKPEWTPAIGDMVKLDKQGVSWRVHGVSGDEIWIKCYGGGRGCVVQKADVTKA